MATSSITHNFVITTPEAAERFANAVEESFQERNMSRIRSNCRSMQNPDEIKAFMEKREKLLNAR